MRTALTWAEYSKLNFRFIRTTVSRTSFVAQLIPDV